MNRLPRKRKKALKAFCEKHQMNFKSYIHMVQSWYRIHNYGRKYQNKLLKYYGYE